MILATHFADWLEIDAIHRRSNDNVSSVAQVQRPPYAVRHPKRPIHQDATRHRWLPVLAPQALWKALITFAGHLNINPGEAQAARCVINDVLAEYEKLS
jgi:hypothetical protein